MSPEKLAEKRLEHSESTAQATPDAGMDEWLAECEDQSGERPNDKPDKRMKSLERQKAIKRSQTRDNEHLDAMPDTAKHILDDSDGEAMFGPSHWPSVKQIVFGVRQPSMDDTIATEDAGVMRSMFAMSGNHAKLLSKALMGADLTVVRTHDVIDMGKATMVLAHPSRDGVAEVTVRKE